MDKFEGLQCEGGVLDRNYCDDLEIQAFLETVGASALFVDPAPGKEPIVFVETSAGYDWRSGPALCLTEQAAVEEYDFVFVHYDEASFAHYDPVYEL